MRKTRSANEASDHPRTIAATARKVGASDLDAAVRAWRADCETTPAAFFGLLESDLDALPYLRRTVVSLLDELPASNTALTATERLLLSVIALGDVSPGRVLRHPGSVHGPWGMGRILDRLAACPVPAIVGLLDGPFEPALHDAEARHDRYRRSGLSLSPFGRSLLDGTDDFSRHTIHRWWGGLSLTMNGCGAGMPSIGRYYRRTETTDYFSRIGVARSTGTTVTLFCGDPSMTRSE